MPGVGIEYKMNIEFKVVVVQDQDRPGKFIANIQLGSDTLIGQMHNVPDPRIETVQNVVAQFLASKSK